MPNGKLYFLWMKCLKPPHIDHKVTRSLVGWAQTPFSLTMAQQWLTNLIICLILSWKENYKQSKHQRWFSFRKLYSPTQSSVVSEGKKNVFFFMCSSSLLPCQPHKKVLFLPFSITLRWHDEWQMRVFNNKKKEIETKQKRSVVGLLCRMMITLLNGVWKEWRVYIYI